MGLHIKKLDIKGYEEVIEIKDAQRGLHAFIAIHDTTFGPSLGGIRFLPYASREEALTDVLRLSEGMTFKSTVSELKIGGGKSTVIWDPSKPKPKEMLHALGEAINFLEGRYIGAEDMNCTLDDVLAIHEVSPHVLGLPGDGTGDPARFTARGVFISIEAAAQYLWGSRSLIGKNILIQGAGGVGHKLIEHLFWAGANLFITDTNETRLHEVCHEYGATPVNAKDTYDFKCDIFAPCALGGVLNKETIKRLNCKAIAGAANNQLLSPEDGEEIRARGILYAPDYVANAGGIISAASALDPNEEHPQKVLFKVNDIFERLIQIFQLADQENICSNTAADRIVTSMLLKEKEKQNAMV